MTVGQNFQHFQEWSEFLKNYEKENQQKFCMSGKTLKSRNKVNIANSEAIKYDRIEYTCKFGPKKTSIAKDRTGRQVIKNFISQLFARNECNFYITKVLLKLS